MSDAARRQRRDCAPCRRRTETPRALAYGTHDDIARFLEPHTTRAPAPAAPAAPAALAIGAGVSHPTFGAGTIVGRDGDKARVKFADGERVLLAKFLRPA